MFKLIKEKAKIGQESTLMGHKMLLIADILVELSDDDLLIVTVVPLLTNMMRLSIKIQDFPFNLQIFKCMLKV